MDEKIEELFRNFSHNGPLTDDLMTFANKMADELCNFEMSNQEMRIAAGNYYAGYRAALDALPSQEEIEKVIRTFSIPVDIPDLEKDIAADIDALIRGKE